MAASRVSGDFHARFDAEGKQYRYVIWNHAAMDPLLRRTAWHVPRKLDLGLMRQGANLFVGRHDFSSFTANPGYERKSTVRNITRCAVSRRGPLITVTIEGDGFLYKMCRGMVGTLVQVGLGRFPSTGISQMLAQRDRRVAGMTAPANGLILWKVYYSNSRKKPGKPSIHERSSS
jgi:tRNA pseudouridine38-40 synthase